MLSVAHNVKERNTPRAQKEKGGRPETFVMLQIGHEWHTCCDESGDDSSGNRKGCPPSQKTSTKSLTKLLRIKVMCCLGQKSVSSGLSWSE